MQNLFGCQKQNSLHELSTSYRCENSGLPATGPAEIQGTHILQSPSYLANGHEWNKCIVDARRVNGGGDGGGGEDGDDGDGSGGDGSRGSFPVRLDAAQLGDKY